MRIANRDGMQGIFNSSDAALIILLVAARRGRRLKLAVRRVLDSFLRSKDADQFFGFVVIRREIFITDGPIETLAVATVRLEVVRAHPQ